MNTGELVYSWLLVLDSEAPTVTKHHKVDVKRGHISEQMMEFVSRMKTRAVFEFTSSNEDLMLPKVKSLPLAAGESKLIDLHFPALNQTGAHVAYLFANDVDHNVVECYEMRIHCYE